MKTNAIKRCCISLLISGVLVLVVGVNSASAQDKAKKDAKVVRMERIITNNGRQMGLGLTKEQQDKMKNLRGEHMKATQLLKAQVAEKAAHIKTLTVVDNPDFKAINKTIDEMMALKGEILKRTVSMKQAVKEILTPEQFQQFQARMGKMRHERGGMQFGRGQMMRGQRGGMQFGHGQMMGGQRGMNGPRGMQGNPNMSGKAQMNVRIQKGYGPKMVTDTVVIKK